MTKPTLIVMAKAPVIGGGKTRLAREIGAAEAWRINRGLHAHTLRLARDERWRTMLCVSPRAALDVQLPGVWPRNLPRALQCAGDLGARLAAAMAPHRFVAVIGSDCPMIDRRHIAAAFTALRRAPFALGPTHDGGFWLLAARKGRDAARAMSGVRWSSQYAARDVLSNLAPRTVARLPTLRDIDVLEDLQAVRAQRSARR